MNPDPLAGCLSGSGYRVIFVVFSVCYQDQRPASRGVQAEAPDPCEDGLAEGRPLAWYGACIDGVEEKFGAYIIRCDRKLHKGIPGKNYQSYPVAVQVVSQA